MHSQLGQYLRLMRIVVLIGFIIWLLQEPNGLQYFFTAVCVVLIVITAIQLWMVHNRGE